MSIRDCATASWPQLGTTALVRVADPNDLPFAERLLRAELARADRAASNYRDDSELAAVCRAAGTAVAVSSYFSEMVIAAVGAAEASYGLVDPTIGHNPGWKAIMAGDWSVSVPRGAQLDLGATGKAFAADRAAKVIATAINGRGVLVSLGGDIATAGRAPQGGWVIHVTDDHRCGRESPGQTVVIQDGALATSGTALRTGPGGHHITDPRTGVAAETMWRTVSATAANCVDANTATTAAVILGHYAPGWLSAQGLAARLVANDGEVTTVGGWPSDGRIQELGLSEGTQHDHARRAAA
jgi:FAD:protein FMN transferase